MSADPSAATTEWERFDYENGETIWQRECPDCDRGLLLAPVRFCQRCQGSGYLTTTVDPARAARELSAATLRWHYEDGTWWAESPEFPEWSGGASSLDEARLLAHEGLRFCAENDALTIIDPFGELPASVTW